MLLLRSFGDDVTSLGDGSGFVELHALRSCETFEEVVTRQLKKLGPPIAIGRPGESLPPAGAARMYVSDDRWQAQVERLAIESQRIVLLLGKTPGLHWEIQKLFELGLLEKLILLFPPSGEKDRTVRWTMFLDAVRSVENLEIPDEIPAETIAAVFRGRRLEAIRGHLLKLQDYETGLQEILADSMTQIREQRLRHYLGTRLTNHLLTISRRTRPIVNMVFITVTLIIAVGLQALALLGVMGIALALIFTPGVRDHPPSREAMRQQQALSLYRREQERNAIPESRRKGHESRP